jgi:hypothetical protein
MSVASVRADTDRFGVERTAARDQRRLLGAAAFFAVAVLLHNLDHLRRGGASVSADVFWVGSAAIIVEVLVVVFAFARHPLAPLVAASAGFGLAAGYVVVHFTPHRAFLSDSLLRATASPLSIAAAVLESAAALTIGVVGVGILRRRRAGPTPDGQGTGRRGLVSTLGHPLVAVMLAGNVLIFLGSIATR